MYFRGTTFSQICHPRTYHFNDLRPTFRSQVSKISQRHCQGGRNDRVREYFSWGVHVRLRRDSVCDSDSGMFIETVLNRTSPPAILLRESYRNEAGKAQKRTLANLSKLPASLIAGLKGLLKGGVAILAAAGAASEEGLQDRAVAAARPRRGAARHAAQDQARPIAC